MLSIRRMTGVILLCLLLTCAYSNSYAEVEAHNKQEVTLSNKIDTTHLSGINLWIAELYNDNRVLYAVVVVLVMAILGSLIAYVTDLMLQLFGINVGRISHRE